MVERRRSAPALSGLALALAASAPLTSHAQERGPEPETVIPHRQDRVPNRPYSPAEAVARMEVPPGFVVEIVAAEPDIVNPVAMAFDDRGRIWITESVEYPRKPAGEGRDRLKVLEDTDRDGRADRFTVFAGGLNIPSGIAVGHGGVWVLNAPDLLFFREENGRATGREVVVTGFGRTDTHELPNSLTWGPDGWLYGLNGVFNRSRVRAGGRELAFTCALFRVHPRTREFQVVCEGTSNPWGLVWDSEGSAIVSACHWAKDHVFHFVETAYYQRQAGAYPAHTWRIGSVSDHGHQKTAYCGLAWLDSDAYPEPWRGRLYMGNVHGNCINVDVLERDGATYVSRAASDFLTANDAWFMPVSQKVGPDGCLWILDWYDRYHCYQDANRDPEGIDRARGRLYRVRYEGAPRAPAFDLGAESDDELLGRLASPNVFFRERAQRLLVERGTPAIQERLRRVIADADAVRAARLHALWALIGIRPFDAEPHRGLFTHPDSTFRAWAVRAAGDAAAASYGVGWNIRAGIAALAFDAAPEVQLQVAIAAPKLASPDAVIPADMLDPLPVLVNVLAACGEDRLVPAVAWPNLHPLLETRGGEFARLAAGADLARAPALVRVLPRVIARLLAAAHRDLDAVARLLELAARTDAEVARECVGAVAARIGELGSDEIARLAERLRPFIDAAVEAPGGGPLVAPARLLGGRLGILEVDPAEMLRVFGDRDEGDEVRLQALDGLIVAGDERLLDAVGGALDGATASPEAAGRTAFLGAVLGALGRLEDPRVADLVIARFERLDAAVKPLALDLLLERRAWARRLLDAVLEGNLPRETLTPVHLRRILDGNDREAIWAIEKAYGTVRRERSPERERVVAEMARYLEANPGDPVAGRDVFASLCAQCHRLWGEGPDVGPDLTTNGRASFEQLLSNVLDPNLVVGPGYETTTVTTTDGRLLVGRVVADSAARIELVMQGGRRESVPRARVKHVFVRNLSLMPESLEETLDHRRLADLFAFLALDGPPESDPRPIPGAPASLWKGR